MKILLGADGSTFSDAAIRAIATQVHKSGTEILVLSVVPARGPELGANPKEFFTRAQEVVASAAQTLGAAGFSVTTRVVEAEVRTAILDAAKEWRADLIVLGSHGHSGLRRFLLGSVTESVVRNAHCSVLVVRPPEH